MDARVATDWDPPACIRLILFPFYSGFRNKRGAGRETRLLMLRRQTRLIEAGVLLFVPASVTVYAEQITNTGVNLLIFTSKRDTRKHPARAIRG